MIIIYYKFSRPHLLFFERVGRMYFLSTFGRYVKNDTWVRKRIQVEDKFKKIGRCSGSQ